MKSGYKYVKETFEKHQKGYYWLRNSYGFTEVLTTDYFKKELKKITKKEAEKKIEEINNYTKEVKKKKQEVIKKYKIKE